MNIRNALLAATVIAAPLAANAQVVSGPYISGNLGTSYEQNENFKYAGSGKFNWGWTGNASVGYGYGNGFRAELEGNYINNQLNAASGAATAGGREQKYGAFANGLYDFDAGWEIAYPYVGVGVGYQQVQESLVSNLGNVSGSKGKFAAQGIVGVAFPISGVPGLSLTAEYRGQDVFGGRRYDDSTIFNAVNHSFELGLRYAFGVAPAPAPVPVAAPAPAPAPVATPAPAPARTYLVFFDWDKADLTAKAKSIIADAAQASTQVQTTQIAVNGYTDLSGTAAYNQKLSVRRAESVAAELVRDGVQRNEIDIMGFGESNPLVPTAKGVREPQNRRVEIILK
jgi:OmpA-OmpF porin, OOP family